MSISETRKEQDQLDGLFQAAWDVIMAEPGTSRFWGLNTGEEIGRILYNNVEGERALIARYDLRDIFGGGTFDRVIYLQVGCINCRPTLMEVGRNSAGSWRIETYAIVDDKDDSGWMIMVARSVFWGESGLRHNGGGWASEHGDDVERAKEILRRQGHRRLEELPMRLDVRLTAGLFLEQVINKDFSTPQFIAEAGRAL